MSKKSLVLTIAGVIVAGVIVIISMNNQEIRKEIQQRSIIRQIFSNEKSQTKTTQSQAEDAVVNAQNKAVDDTQNQVSNKMDNAMVEVLNNPGSINQNEAPITAAQNQAENAINDTQNAVATKKSNNVTIKDGDQQKGVSNKAIENQEQALAIVRSVNSTADNTRNDLEQTSSNAQDQANSVIQSTEKA